MSAQSTHETHTQMSGSPNKITEKQQQKKTGKYNALITTRLGRISDKCTVQKSSF
jgi:hypothetical protein